MPPIQYDRCPCKRGDTDTRREVNADPQETQSDDRLQALISELTNTKDGQQHWQLGERPDTGPSMEPFGGARPGQHLGPGLPASMTGRPYTAVV